MVLAPPIQCRGDLVVYVYMLAGAPPPLLILSLRLSSACYKQCRIQYVGADRQAQQESYFEIYQHNPINRANSYNINNNEDRKMNFA